MRPSFFSADTPAPAARFHTQRRSIPLALGRGEGRDQSNDDFYGNHPAHPCGHPYGERLAQTLRAFEPTGGVADGDDLATMLRDVHDQPISVLARWIVERQVVGFGGRSHALLPLFQFDLAKRTVRPGVREIIAELSGPFDAWEIAEWFARPNDWLAGRSPASVLAQDWEAVLQAARADRYISS